MIGLFVGLFSVVLVMWGCVCWAYQVTLSVKCQHSEGDYRARVAGPGGTVGGWVELEKVGWTVPEIFDSRM